MPARRQQSPAAPTGGKKPTPPSVRIRMYRLGVGDCFLVRLPTGDGGEFSILVDCGIHMAEPNGAERIRSAATDIVQAVDSRLDVVVGTHEHWDHLSGFHHASEVLAGCRAGEAWCAWTEDRSDPDAVQLTEARDKGVAALWSAVRRASLSGETKLDDIDGLLGFFGESPGLGKLAKAAAMDMRGLVERGGGKVVYRSPGEAPFDSVSDDWRIFVLGPPRSREALRRAEPRLGTGEAYGLGHTALGAANLAATMSEDDDPPFDKRYAMSLEGSRSLPFFRDRYWSDLPPTEDRDPGGSTKPGRPNTAKAPNTSEGVDNKGGDEEFSQAWRRIDGSWMQGAENLALKLDKMTNNTSLVLALEIGPRDGRENPVILFAADAQVGNWLSWGDVVWPDYAGRRVTGDDLLRRTIVYKVGHHASHNATPRDRGLELMRNLRLALVPTSEEMAKKVKWGTLPWPGLLERLEELTGDRLLRSDKGASPAALADMELRVREVGTEYFDVEVPLALRLRDP